jgi:hypothetical protein
MSAPSPTTGRACAAQHPAAYDAGRLGRRRLVEHGGRGGAPVDQQRVAVRVAQPDPADVARLGVELLAQVEPAEDQALVGGVELGDPPRGLEDHGVALDEPALVAQAAAPVALAREGLGRAGRALQLDVDAVDDRLLGCDLALGELIRHVHFPLFPVDPRIRQVLKPTRDRARRVTGSRRSPGQKGSPPPPAP